LTPADKAIVVESIGAVQDNEQAMNLLLPETDSVFKVESFNEDTILIDYVIDDNIFNLKVKIDNWSIDKLRKKICLNDVKTTSDPIWKFMGYQAYDLDMDGIEPSMKTMYKKGSFQYYHYYRQMYMYRELLLAYIEKHYNIDISEYTVEVNMIVVEKSDFEAKCHVYTVEDHWLEQGESEFMYLMSLLNYYTNNGFTTLNAIKAFDIVV